MVVLTHQVFTQIMWCSHRKSGVQTVCCHIPQQMVDVWIILSDFEAILSDFEVGLELFQVNLRCSHTHSAVNTLCVNT